MIASSETLDLKASEARFETQEPSATCNEESHRLSAFLPKIDDLLEAIF